MSPGSPAKLYCFATRLPRQALTGGDTDRLDAVIKAHIDGIAATLDLEPVHFARAGHRRVRRRVARLGLRLHCSEDEYS